MEKKVMLMSDYTVYCTEEQTKKAFELGAPVEILDCTVWLDDRLCAGCVEGVSNQIPRMTDYLYEDGERVESLMLIEGTEEYGDLVCLKPTAEQMIEYMLDTGKGNSVELGFLIQTHGYKQGCLTFIDKYLK